MTKFGFHTFSLLVLVLCFVFSNAEASDGVKTAQDDTKDPRQSAELAPSRQLRVTPNETAEALALQYRNDKSEHRRLFLITSLISKLFGMEEENSNSTSKSSSNSSSSATPKLTSTPTPTPTPTATPSSVPTPRPTPNATLTRTPKPHQDPLGMISW